jgi:spore maturation protein CgeB
MATPEMVRRIASAAKVSLCLVRRANRDQSCMRTFELPAMGACIVAQDTEEHRTFYGPDGEVAHYFSNSDQMIEKVRWLLSNPQIRARTRANAATWVAQNRHTYADRLNAMLASVDRAAEAVA